MSYWAVAQTEPMREHIVRVLLMRLAFETYAPRIKLKGEKIALLFPTYVFVRVIERFYPVLWTPGVIRVLMASERPAHVPDEIVNSIRRREKGGFVRLPSRYPRRGTRMKIIRGSFEGIVAVYDGMAAGDRQRVLLELLGQTVPVELPVRDTVALSQAF